MSLHLAVNPVLSRELRQRVRSRRASTVLTLYLSLLVAAVGLMVWGLEKSNAGDSTVSQGIGRTVFGSLLFLILGLVCFIVPGVAAGAVAGERERLTLVPLQVTLLTPGQVLRGKLLASLAFTTLLLVASLPLLAVAYVLGGVSVPQIAGGLFFVLASAAFLGVLSIWASTVMRRVQRATVVAYGIVGVLVLGTPIAYGVQVVATSSSNSSNRWESLLVLAPNPFLVTADALGHSTEGGGSPFTPSQAALRRRDERRDGLVDDIQAEVTVAPSVNVAPPFNGPMATAAPMPVPAPVPVLPGPSGTGPFIPPPGFSTPTTRFFDPSGGVITGPRGFQPDGGGVVVGQDGSEFMSERRGADVTDRGPIWAWSLGWWVILGGAAYLHAAQKLRLPSAAGVRP